MDLDDIDIYDDLADFGENIGDERCPKELRERIKDLEITVSSLEKQIQELQATKATLEVNLSSLIKTARNEISRKDRMIAELRQERDNTLFRRTASQRPLHPGAQNVDKSSSRAAKETNQVSNKPPNVTAHLRTEITQSYTAKNSSKIEIDEDNDDERLPMDTKLPATTVFGQRLQKKLQEEAEAAKKSLPQSQVPEIQLKLQNDLQSDSERHKNRDNKENQRDVNARLQETASNTELKRPHVNELDRKSEKRRKLEDDVGKSESKSKKIERDTKNQSTVDDSTYFCKSDPRNDDRDHIERSRKHQSRESSRGTSSERRSSHSSHSSRKKDSPGRHSSRDHDSRSKKPDRDHKSSRQTHSGRSRVVPDLRDRITGSKSRPKEPSCDRRSDDKRRDSKSDKKKQPASLSRSSKSWIVKDERQKTQSRSRDRSKTRGKVVESVGKKYPIHRPPSPPHPPPPSPPPPSPAFSPISPFSSPSINKSVEIPKIVELTVEKTQVPSENCRGKDEKTIPEEKETAENDGPEEGEIVDDPEDDNVDKNGIKEAETEKIECDSSTPVLENHLRSTLPEINAQNTQTESELLESLNTEHVEMGESKFSRVVNVNLTPMKEEKIENIEAFIRNFDPEKCEQLDSAGLLNTTMSMEKNLEYEADDKEKCLSIAPEINANNQTEAFKPAETSETTPMEVDKIACDEEKNKVLEINEKSKEECVETAEWSFQDNEIGATVEISMDQDDKDETGSVKIPGEIPTTIVDDKLKQEKNGKVFSPPMVILGGKENLNCENSSPNDLGRSRVEKMDVSTRQATKDSEKNASSAEITSLDDNSNSNDKLKMDSIKNDDKVSETSPNLIIDETSRSKLDAPKTVRKSRKGAAAVAAKTNNTPETNEKQQKEKKTGVKKSQQIVTPKSDVKVVRRKKFKRLSDASSSVVLVVSERKSDV